jgi:hypothetical protein
MEQGRGVLQKDRFVHSLDSLFSALSSAEVGLFRELLVERNRATIRQYRENQAQGINYGSRYINRNLLLAVEVDRAMGPHGPGLRAIWAPICRASMGPKGPINFYWLA